MSLADAMIAGATAAYDAIHADQWTVLGSGILAGITFLGDAQSETAVELGGELGADAREKVFLYVNRPAIGLRRGMMLNGKGATWIVAGDLDDNPANDRARFEIVKKAENDT